MAPPFTATLQDVADRARVHRSTVALALRDHPRISAGTRQRVQAIAKRVGYKVNPLVAALMRSRRSGATVRHEVIAYVTCYSTRYGWKPQHHNRPNFYPGAQKRARELGYKLEHFWYAEEGMTPTRFRDVLRARGIHGLIIGRMPPGRESLELDWRHFSAVALGMTLRSPGLHRVTENHFDTAWSAMQQCRARGYRRVGFVYSEANDSPAVGDRWLGAYLQQQLQTFPGDQLPVCPGMPTDRDTFVTWYREHRPDALLVTHAEPVVGWLNSIGCSVPNDVGMVELQDNVGGNASGICYDPAAIGAVAVELLAGLMYHNQTGIPENPHEVILAGAWQEGVTLPVRAKTAVQPSCAA
jgi:LacI family transcriptional regulator